MAQRSYPVFLPQPAYKGVLIVSTETLAQTYEVEAK